MIELHQKEGSHNKTNWLRNIVKDIVMEFKIKTGLVRRNFNNRDFWDHRYLKNKELGSGIGSRGETKKYKRELLQQIVDQIKPESVLDIGCGDMEVSSVLPAKNYMGLDISKVVIEHNRIAYSNRNFISGNFLEMDLSPADIVISFDVLIHLPSCSEYKAFVQKIVALAMRYGIISGYESVPVKGAQITFFHEPLSKTLQSAGAQNIRKIGEYQQVTIFRFEKHIQ
ncbi:MAG: class I SAM-dependent methyltransferase [Candidatus Jettenia sp.]|nr:class I SAM-dependent methyltransferase [Candidatus Jettenia sp.]